MNSKELAWNIRKDTVRMVYKGNSSHIGSALSSADIIAVLYADILEYDNKNPKYDKRDRLILSKGHAGSAIYSALSNVGFFNKSILDSHCQDDSDLSGHISEFNVPGVEISTGSLGQGLSIGAGMALAIKCNEKKQKVYVILGDGECNEGSIWEAALFSSRYKLGNLVTIIDNNNLQGLGTSDGVLNLNPLADKWKSFGWNTIEIDGHNHDEIRKSLLNLKKNQPTAIIAHTIKGKGISFMENKLQWHYTSPNEEQYKCANEELEEMKP